MNDLYVNGAGAGVPTGIVFWVGLAAFILYALPPLALWSFTAYRLYGDRKYVKQHGKVRSGYLSVMGVVRATMFSLVPIVNLFILVYVIGEWLLGLPLWRRPVFRATGTQGGLSGSGDDERYEDGDG